MSCDDFKCFASQARNCKQKRRNFRPKIKPINLSHQEKNFLFFASALLTTRLRYEETRRNFAIQRSIHIVYDCSRVKFQRRIAEKDKSPKTRKFLFLLRKLATRFHYKELSHGFWAAVFCDRFKCCAVKICTG